MSDPPIDPARCPACGHRNECGLVAGRSTCWCFEEEVPAAALEKIPPEARGVACLCRACATGHRTPSKVLELFRELLRMRTRS